MTWDELNATVAEVEAAERERRIVRVFSNGDALPKLFYGRFGNAPVEMRERSGYQWSDGEIVDL